MFLDTYLPQSLLVGRYIISSVLLTCHCSFASEKLSLDVESGNNCRSISNLRFISKLLEHIVARGMEIRLSSNSLYLPIAPLY